MAENLLRAMYFGLLAFKLWLRGAVMLYSAALAIVFYGFLAAIGCGLIAWLSGMIVAGSTPDVFRALLGAVGVIGIPITLAIVAKAIPDDEDDGL